MNQNYDDVHRILTIHFIFLILPNRLYVLQSKNIHYLLRNFYIALLQHFKRKQQYAILNVNYRNCYCFFIFKYNPNVIWCATEIIFVFLNPSFIILLYSFALISIFKLLF